MSEKPENRLDLSALDPRRDEERFERSVRSIAARLAPTLAARRARKPDLWTLLAAWQRPVLAAAAVLAVALVAALMRLGPLAAPGSSNAVSAHSRVASPKPAATRQPSTLLEAAGVPAAVAEWAETGTAPSGSSVLELGGG